MIDTIFNGTLLEAQMALDPENPAYEFANELLELRKLNPTDFRRLHKNMIHQRYTTDHDVNDVYDFDFASRLYLKTHNLKVIHHRFEKGRLTFRYRDENYAVYFQAVTGPISAAQVPQEIIQYILFCTNRVHFIGRI